MKSTSHREGRRSTGRFALLVSLEEVLQLKVYESIAGLGSLAAGSWNWLAYPTEVYLNPARKLL